MSPRALESLDRTTIYATVNRPILMLNLLVDKPIKATENHRDFILYIYGTSTLFTDKPKNQGFKIK